WNVAGIKDMSFMFSGASAFNQDIGGWNVASVTNMESIFSGASAFNQNISGWNVASVVTMYSMFFNASAFNQDIGGWNVAGVVTMRSMFFGASAFNQDIGDWNVASVTFMNFMFNRADAFNQNLGRWYVDETVDNDQGMLQTVNSNYDGVNNLNVLSFNFVAQNSTLRSQNPSYALAIGAAAEGADNARFNLISNTLSFKSGMAADGSYTVRIAVGNAGFGSSNSIDLTVVVDGTDPTANILDSFITVWRMPADGLTLTFPSEGSYTIEWGDGTPDKRLPAITLPIPTPLLATTQLQPQTPSPALT
ncbi:MAG: DUF285 domain-containing protein, partial [Methylococcales symbiont of Iophon sp. n. MRB-2018]